MGRRPQKGPAVSDTIQEMVGRIVARFAPEKIILFGSQARDTAGPHSDVDLLVVMECPGSTRQQVVEIRKALADIAAPKDVVVVTPEYFERYRNVVGTVVWPAVREGKLLYERAA
jgi:predicted nucleotidyltransferase